MNNSVSGFGYVVLAKTPPTKRKKKEGKTTLERDRNSKEMGDCECLVGEVWFWLLCDGASWCDCPV